MKTIIATLLLLILYYPSAVWSEGFGYDGESDLSEHIEDAIWANRSSPAYSGTLDSIKVYLEVTSQAHNVKLAVYKWSDTSFVDSTEIIDVPVSEGWVYFDFVNNAEITISTEYALAVVAEAGAGFCKVTLHIGSGSDAAQEPFTYGVWPTPKWTTVSAVGNNELLIYCYYTRDFSEATGQVIFIQ